MKISNKTHRERMRLIVAAYLRLTERYEILPENVNYNVLTKQYGYVSYKRIPLLKDTLMDLTSYRKQIRRHGIVPEVWDTLQFVYVRLKIINK